MPGMSYQVKLKLGHALVGVFRLPVISVFSGAASARARFLEVEPGPQAVTRRCYRAYLM